MVVEAILLKGIMSLTPRTRKVDIFTQQDYEKLWLVIGSIKNPEILLTTLIFLAAKVLSLRAGDELCGISMKNFEIKFGTVPHDKDLVKIR